jgi:hypothetical protein
MMFSQLKRLPRFPSPRNILDQPNLIRLRLHRQLRAILMHKLAFEVIELLGRHTGLPFDGGFNSGLAFNQLLQAVKNTILSFIGLWLRDLLSRIVLSDHQRSSAVCFLERIGHRKVVFWLVL